MCVCVWGGGIGLCLCEKPAQSDIKASFCPFPSFDKVTVKTIKARYAENTRGRESLMLCHADCYLFYHGYGLSALSGAGEASSISVRRGASKTCLTIPSFNKIRAFPN